LATITGLNILFLGPPGTAKSNLVTAYQSLFFGTKKFEKLLTKFTTPEEIFGPFSLKALENDEYYRQLDGYLADCHFAFIDETFKSSSALLNSLLTVMNERKFTNGKTILDVPLLTLVGASNEIPEESDGLTALFDRFHLKYMVKPIQERSNRIKMLMSNTVINEPILTLDELYAIKQEVKQVVITEEVADMYANVIGELSKEGLAATDRTYKMSMQVLKAEAYLNGRSVVNENDFDILQHVLWTDPDQRKKVYTLILNLVNPEKNQILKLYESANEISDRIAVTTDKIEQMKYSVEAANKLKDIKNKLHEYYTRYKKNNKDVAEIKKYEDSVDAMLANVFKVHLGVGMPSSI
jgi:MoxR-like ATPase